MMTDEHLIVLTKEVDELLAALCLKHNASPLTLAAVLNARLIWACRETQTEDDYFKLISGIQGKQHDTASTTSIKH